MCVRMYLLALLHGCVCSIVYSIWYIVRLVENDGKIRSTLDKEGGGGHGWPAHVIDACVGCSDP